MVGLGRHGSAIRLFPFLLLLSSASSSDVVDVDLSSARSPFPHYWKRSFGSGHATLTLRPDWQSHLVQAVKELGLSGVRHHGLLDDDMGVVNVDGSYNFTNIESSWDFQRSHGVAPIVELSFSESSCRRSTAPAPGRLPPAVHSPASSIPPWLPTA